MSAEIETTIARLAERQGGHVTRAQLTRVVGLSRRAIEHRVRRGLLIRVHHGVYAVGRRPTDPIDRARGALLATGERSALAGASAARYWGIWRLWPDPPELLTPTDRRPSTLKVRRCASLTRRDVVEIENGLRVTSTARTLLDIAPRLTSGRLTRAVNDLRLRMLLSVEDLQDVIARNPRNPGITPLRPLLEVAQPEPSRSELEDAFMKLVVDHGLPVPQVNVRVAGHRVDALFPAHRLVVELDGWASHRSRASFAHDRRQDADILAQTGMPTVRLLHDNIVHHPGSTAKWLLSVLEAGPGFGTPAHADPDLPSPAAGS